ncbi:MAG: hypothetical protein ACOVNY_06410 [Chitinophagaceae bacterium]
MKKTLVNIFSISLFVLCFSSCIKQLEKQYQGETLAEIDAAVLNSNATGLTYPIISRHPRPGIPINSTNAATSCEIPQADSTIRRIGRQVSLRINIIGAQASTERTVGYRLITSPITTFAFPATVTSVTTVSTCSNPNLVIPAQSPSAAAATLTVSDAVSGTHFSPLSGKITIPANSSFGTLVIPLLTGSASAGSARFLGIQLDSTGTILPALNLRTLGILIDQR